VTEPMYAWDCDNDHHGHECGRTPCRCECHGRDRPVTKREYEQRDATTTAATAMEPEP
jgi:hypothetical protein